MATWIGADIAKFQDRGYIYNKPTPEECISMAWTQVRAYAGKSIDDTESMKEWCKANIWWQDYVWDYGTIYFKYQQDVVFFNLRWL